MRARNSARSLVCRGARQHGRVSHPALASADGMNACPGWGRNCAPAGSNPRPFSDSGRFRCSGPARTIHCERRAPVLFLGLGAAQLVDALVDPGKFRGDVRRLLSEEIQLRGGVHGLGIPSPPWSPRAESQAAASAETPHAPSASKPAGRGVARAVTPHSACHRSDPIGSGAVKSWHCAAPFKAPVWRRRLRGGFSGLPPTRFIPTIQRVRAPRAPGPWTTRNRGAPLWCLVACAGKTCRAAAFNGPHDRRLPDQGLDGGRHRSSRLRRWFLRLNSEACVPPAPRPVPVRFPVPLRQRPAPLPVRGPRPSGPVPSCRGMFFHLLLGDSALYDKERVEKRFLMK